MEEEQCSTVLGLGIGGGENFIPKLVSDRKVPVQFHHMFPSRMKEEEEEGLPTKAEPCNSRSRSKSDDDAALKDASDGGYARKKLRLSKEQSSLLEDSFRVHNTLTPGQKQELAERLNLRPRQVEVWFQNRRARTKLKQTEVDCEFLKKCCESLSDENRRLKRELHELRALTPSGSPLYIHLPKAATLSMCPSCERIAGGSAKAGTADAGLDKSKFPGFSSKGSSMAC